MASPESLYFILADSEYTNKSITSLPRTAGMANQENATGEKSLEEIPFAKREPDKLKADTNRNSPNHDATSTVLESSFHFEIKTEKQIAQSESKPLSDYKGKRNELWIKTENSSLASSVENKSTPVSENLAKSSSGAISMEDLVSKSISRSAVEPPLINSDAPSMRYKSFECRNYGDEPNFDKFIRTSELDQKRTSEPKATLAPIRYHELVRSVPSSGISTTSGNYTITKASSSDVSHPERKCSSKNLPIPSLISTTRSPTPDVFSKHSSVSDKPRTSVESKSPNMPKYVTPRSGVVSSSRSPSSISISGSKVPTLLPDRKNAPNPFQPVIVKHEFQSSEGSQGIKQEISSSGLSNSDSKSLLTQSGPELGKQNIEFKGLLGFNESASTGSPRPSQEAEDLEKSFKTTPKTLSRSHTTLISRSSNSLPPSLPVGVAHPYPRASDVVSHAKGSEQKTSVSASSVASGILSFT